MRAKRKQIKQSSIATLFFFIQFNSIVVIIFFLLNNFTTDNPAESIQQLSVDRLGLQDEVFSINPHLSNFMNFWAILKFVLYLKWKTKNTCQKKKNKQDIFMFSLHTCTHASDDKSTHN
ncbi:hypothetical protein T4C_10647 [Trichinella pseudospiralis]|uniref:Uncharacterized protein n=1 Tax=Trichinella pseudospiralis TaxID=6337 RepID=A0A0V1J4G2_TRIPS|nr:hypothetical protein T4C_10647 [Trichinella pseudospiralis]